MAIQTTDPVIQIVDRYEQDVRLGCLSMSFPGEEKRKDSNCDCLNESACSSVIHIYFFSCGGATRISFLRSCGFLAQEAHEEREVSPVRKRRFDATDANPIGRREDDHLPPVHLCGDVVGA